MSLAFWLRRCRCRSQRGKGMECSKGKEGGRSIESGCRLYSVLHVVVVAVVVAAESKLRAARLHSRRQVTPPVPVAVAVAVRLPHVPHLLRAKPITYKIHELTSWQRATCNSNSGSSSSRRRQATTTHIHLQANAPQPPTSDNNNSNSNANRRRLSRLLCPLSPPFPTLSLCLCLCCLSFAMLSCSRLLCMKCVPPPSPALRPNRRQLCGSNRLSHRSCCCCKLPVVVATGCCACAFDAFGILCETC